MERLTERDGSIVYYPHCNNAGKCGGHCSICDFEVKAMNKLADYEDAEEQGLLLRLQCNVGDIIWDVDYGKPCAYTITGYSFGTAEDYIDEPIKEDEIVYYYTNSNGSINGSFTASAIGESLFLSKEEAEKSLAGKKEV